MKELKIEELSLEQKIGMTLIAYVSWDGKNVDYIIDLVKKRSLGAVWVVPKIAGSADIIKRIKAAADYPILIFTDAESGLGDFMIGRHNTIGCTGSEELAYTFGKVTAIQARALGYNVVCNPILDMANDNYSCGGNVRSLGSDKEQVAKLAAAVARGMHDGGVLTVGKHYPGNGEDGSIDTHMAESFSMLTEKELLDYNLYPYMELDRQGLLDGIMVSHARFANIDPDRPASLSKKCIDIIRRQGFDGLSLTDALVMMGIVAKFGREKPVPMAIEAGNDLSLPFNPENEAMYNYTMQGYLDGMITDERLNEAVRRVLDAQRKTIPEPKFREITEEDKVLFDRLNRDSIIEICDEGIPKALDRSKKYFFAVTTEMPMDIEDRDKVEVATFTSPWYDPFYITDKIKELFPNSAVELIPQYPTPTDNWRILEKSLGLETVFVTFFPVYSFIGEEHFTSRIISLISAMQVTDRISTIVHFGNPYLLEDLPHTPRTVIAPASTDSTGYAIDVLAGELEARGTLTYNVKFNQKGDLPYERIGL